MLTDVLIRKERQDVRSKNYLFLDDNRHVGFDCIRSTNHLVDQTDRTSRSNQCRKYLPGIRCGNGRKDLFRGPDTGSRAVEPTGRQALPYTSYRAFVPPGIQSAWHAVAGAGLLRAK